MLGLAVILLVFGGVIAYLGRTRERWLFYAGVLICVAGAIVLAVWLIEFVGAETDVEGAFLLPIAWLLRRIADLLDPPRQEAPKCLFEPITEWPQTWAANTASSTPSSLRVNGSEDA